MHAVEAFRAEVNGKTLSVRNVHAPLFSPGQGKILAFDNEYADFCDGISFNLYNNLWGTNFRMWFEDDVRFVFEFRYGC